MSSPLDVLESFTLQAEAKEPVVEMSSPSPSETETVVEVPTSPPGDTIDVSLTGPGIAVAIAVAVGAYMLGKLAQIWLKNKLKKKNQSE